MTDGVYHTLFQSQGIKEKLKAIGFKEIPNQNQQQPPKYLFIEAKKIGEPLYKFRVSLLENNNSMIELKDEVMLPEEIDKECLHLNDIVLQKSDNILLSIEHFNAIYNMEIQGQGKLKIITKYPIPAEFRCMVSFSQKGIQKVLIGLVDQSIVLAQISDGRLAITQRFPINIYPNRMLVVPERSFILLTDWEKGIQTYLFKEKHDQSYDLDVLETGPINITNITALALNVEHGNQGKLSIVLSSFQRALVYLYEVNMP